MGDIVIATAASAPVVRQWLSREMSIVDHEGLAVQLSEWETGSETFLACSCPTVDKSAEEVFVYYVASALAGAILTHLEAEWVKRRLRRVCGALPADERDTMAARILEILAKAYADSEGLPRARVLLDLMDYLDANHSVHLEGFIRFRLKEYQKQIEQAIDEAVSEWNVRQEQQEFIELLRYFMASQESHINSVEVIVNRNGLFRLLDESQNVIDNNYLEGFVADLVQGSVDNGDLLISTLITLAPQQVRCHFEERLPVVDTLQGVFAERMTICRGCELCGLHQGEQRKGSLPAHPKGC